jgi:glycosyltransferase involved in cell wall biosynthesis
MFTNTYLPHVGGVARSVHFFAEDLRKMGNRVLIVAPTFSAENGVTENEDSVLRVPAIQNFNGSDFSVRIPIPFFIDEKIDEFKPDVVHSHHPFLLGDAAIRAAYRRNLPLVFTHHTLYEQYTHYVSPGSEVMKQLAINLSTEYANLCTRVIAPSESIATLITERGVNTPIEIIPTGVDVAHFQNGDGKKFRQAHTIPEDAVVLGHLGRLAPEKNLEYLCDAAILAIQKKPEQLYFLVVGSGPSASEMENYFARAGLQNKLIMAGEKSGEDLVDAYNAMDLFVFSSHSETQGMVLVEAMSASLPVIALDASGVREVVADQKNGRLLAADATPDHFADAILHYAKEKSTGVAWSKEAQSTAQKFSRERSAEKILALYHSLHREQQYEKTAQTDELEPWQELVQSLKIEWDLLSGKTNALLNSIQSESSEEQ